MVQIVLVLAAVSTGLFTGLLVTILAYFQKALKGLSAPEFALVMRRFLEAVRTHPLNYGLVTTSVVAPGAALVLLRGSTADLVFLLVLAGLIAFVSGPVFVSRFYVEPVYDVFLGWKVESPPEDWQVARDLYFRLNRLRGLGSGAAFVLFLAGLALL